MCLGHFCKIAQYNFSTKNDKLIILLQDQCLTRCIEEMFKVYQLCKAALPAQLQSVYSLLECVYDRTVSGGSKVELITKLQTVS